MKEISPAGIAWTVLGVGVVTYDILAPEGETFSEGFARGMEHPVYRYMCAGGLGYTALHLLGLLPQQVDLFHHGLTYIKKT